MSIRPSLYTLKCDSCGGSTVFPSSEQAAAWARKAGWREEGAKHFCTRSTCQKDQPKK